MSAMDSGLKIAEMTVVSILNDFYDAENVEAL